MKIITDEFQLATQGETDIVNITEQVEGLLAKTKMKEGMAVIFAVGSTAAVTTCEFEAGLVQDLKEMFERVFPKKIPYAHDATWGDANGFSHVRASLVGSSLAVPFKEGEMVLGTWQQIILIDFDNTPRRRRVVVQFQGE